MLLRLLFILLAFYVVLSILKTYLAGNRARRNRRPAERAGEDMVQDPQCLSYVPKGAAIEQAGKYFCSEACARLYLIR